MTTQDKTLNNDLRSKIKEKNEIIKYKNIDTTSSSQLFISSTSKGNLQSSDQRSFSGWGYFMAEEKPDGNVFEFSQYGNMFNSDPIESSIKGAIEAIKKLRNNQNLEIVFDNSYVPLLLSSNNMVGDEKQALEKMDKNTPEYWRFNRRLNLIEMLKSTVSGNNYIKGLAIRYSDCLEHSLEPNDDQIFADKKGFELSENKAEQGFKKSIKGAIWYLINNQDSRDLGKSIVTCRKNLNNSFEATKEMMLLLSEMKDGTLPRDIRTKVVLVEFEDLISNLRSMNSRQEKDIFIESKKDLIKLVSDKQSRKTGQERENAYTLTV